MNNIKNKSNKGITASNFYEYWQIISAKYPELPALKDEYTGINYTFKETFEAIKNFASGLKSLGLKKHDHICIFSENSARWMIADQAILISSMVNAVRGAHAPSQELAYILKHSDSVALIVENIGIAKSLQNEIASSKIKLIITLSNDKNDDMPCSTYNFDEVSKIGKNIEYSPTKLNQEDLATLIYTSGTTSQPKGVMLTQGNLLSQVKNCHSNIYATTGKALCILPIWHAYERAVEYYLLSRGVTMCYTNLKNFKKDLQKYSPHYLASVPRIWESVYEGIFHQIGKMPKRKQQLIKSIIEKSTSYKNAQRLLARKDINNSDPSITQQTKAIATIISNYAAHQIAQKLIYTKFQAAVGKEFRKGISGGGALSKHLDDFFDAIGIEVLNGYGLTEASPVVSVRSSQNKNLGSIGKTIDNTQIKICHPETLKKLQKGDKGILFIKGPQVMKGYYKNPEATKEVLDKNGWLNTGDLVKLTPDNSIVITGRAKDTIVLSNGENIEPQAIEEVCLKSPLIKQIILTGQDQSSLGALVVPDNDYISENLDSNESQVQILIKKEVQKLVRSRANYNSFERISDVRLVNEEFSPKNGLMTQTLKIKRNKVFEKYAEIIESMFS